MRTASLTIRAVKHPRYNFRVSFSQGGSYEQRYFKTKKEAKSFADDKKVELLNDGRRHGEFTDAERRAVIEAREVGAELASQGIEAFTVQEAVSFFASHLRTLKKSTTIDKALTEFLDARKIEGVSESHLHDLTCRLGKFKEHFPGRLVASFTTGEVKAWLLGLKCQPQTRLNYQRVLSNFFGFCVDLDYASANPVTGALNVKVPPKDEIGILTVSEAAKLLAACSADVLPAVAIGMFAGLRREEIARLDWRDVNLQKGFIDVKAANAKKKRRRIVDMRPNLRAWLRPYGTLEGKVRPSEALYRKGLSAASTAAGIIPWPSNALRHSFASYHLAAYDNAAKTSLQLGHRDSEVLFNHYRELVHRKDAKEFWKLAPANGQPKKRKPTHRKVPKRKPSNIVSMQEAAA